MPVSAETRCPLPVNPSVAVPPVVALALSVALCVPATVGAKRTRTLQLPPPGSVVTPFVHSPVAGASSVNPEPAAELSVSPIADEVWSPVLFTTKVLSEVEPTSTLPNAADEPLATVTASRAMFCAVPENAATAAPPGVALTLRLAVLLPADFGANATTTMQVLPPGSAPAQLLVTIVKSLALAPPSAAASAVPLPAGTPPVLVTVKVWLALVAPTSVLGKVKAVGFATSDAEARPVPVSETVAVLPPVAANCSVPLMGPGAVGAKRTVTEQEVEGASIIVLQPLVTIANTVEPTMLAVTGPVVDCPELLTVKVAGWADRALLDAAEVERRHIRR